MLSVTDFGVGRPSTNSSPPAVCSLWPVDLKLTHVDCRPEDALVHFQGQYLTVCDLDYNILQVEIQNAHKTKAPVNMGEFCLVEDVLSGCWYRGRLQDVQHGQFCVFLIDYGNVLTVGEGRLALATEDLLLLPPKIITGFLANLLPVGKCWDCRAVEYLKSTVGAEVSGHIQALLPHKVIILEVPTIMVDLQRLNLARYMDRDTFLLLVEILTEAQVIHHSEPVLDQQSQQEFSFLPSTWQDFDSIMSSHGLKLPKGSRERARITAATNASTFYCQPVRMVEDLKAMLQKLTRLCEANSRSICSKNPSNLGLFCAVKGRDQHWHRGLVQFLPFSSQVQVLFVDYGFCDSVKVEDIQQLPFDYLLTSIMAFPCTLSCGSEDKCQLGYLKQGLLGEVLDVHVDAFCGEKNLYYVTLQPVEDDHCVDVWEAQYILSKRDSYHATPTIGPQVDQRKNKTSDFTYLEKSVDGRQSFTGFVVYAVSPNCFWMREKEFSGRFEDMMDKLTKYFQHLKLDEGVLDNPVPGALCCAMYEKEMQYYRAKVVNVFKNEAEIFYIDLGHTEKVPIVLIKKLPPQFAKESGFALPCSLAYVTSVEDVWTVRANDYFRQATSSTEFFVHVVHKRKEKNDVELYEKGREGGASINYQMAAAGNAVFWKNKTWPAVQSKLGKKKKFAKGKSSFNYKYCIKSAQQNKETPCANESLQSISTESPVQNAAPVKRISFKSQLLRPGSEHMVKCSHINSPLDFWCQPVAKLPMLNELMAKMQQYYEDHNETVKPGDACCVVRCHSDNRWYRGCISEDHGSAQDVLLVDCGMTVYDKVQNLRAINPDFVELECQAFRCTLYPGLESTTYGFCNTDATHLLKNFVGENFNKLKCRIFAQVNIKGIGFSNIVDLNATNQSITKLLLKNGSMKQMLKSIVAPSVEMLSYVFSIFGIKPCNEESVYVTHVCSPWEFYIQLERNAEMFDLLMKEVTEKVSEMQAAGSSSNTTNCQICLAKYFVDSKWYRGLASTVPSSMHLNVFFVDFGNMHIIEKHNVMPIPPNATNLLRLPMQALKCSLSGVPKREDLADVNTWLEMATLNKVLKATVVGKEADDGTIICDLFDGNLHINEKVRELMAKHAVIQIPHTSSLSQDTSSKGQVKAAITAKVNTALQNKSKPNHYKPRLVIPNKFIKNVLQSSIAQCKKSSNIYIHKAHKHIATLKRQEMKEVSRTNEKTCATPRLQKDATLPSLSSLPDTSVKPGSIHVGFVSHFNDMTSFYIQVQTEEDAILRIADHLNSDEFRKENEQIKDVTVGHLVAAKYEEDNCIYRAVVLQVNDEDLKVEFIDYGNSTVVKRTDLFTLSNTVLTQPKLSLHCLLSKCENNITQDELFSKPLLVNFVQQCDAQWKVNIRICKENELQQRNIEGFQKEIVSVLPKNEEQSGKVSLKTQALDSLAKIPERRKKVQNNSDMQGETNSYIHSKPKNRKSRIKLKNGHAKTNVSFQQNESNTPSPCQVPTDQKRTVSNQVITVGQTEEGILLSVLQNGEFYVRFKGNSFAAFGQLIEENAGKCKSVSSIHEGLECIVNSKKICSWCRGVIEKAWLDQGECSIFLLDHGETEVFSVDAIKELSQELKQFPVQAVRCRWRSFSQYSGEVLEMIRKTLVPMIQKDLKLTFSSYCETSKLWLVEDIVNLGAEIQQIDQETLSPKPKDSSLPKQGVEDRTRLPRFPLPSMKVGVTLQGLATAVWSPHEFHIILEDSFISLSTVSVTLEELPEELVPLPEAVLVPGLCCLVKPLGKRKWCRAEVVHVSTSTILVDLVDYNQYECVPYENRSELKSLPEKLLGIPKLTHACSLRGVKPLETEHWTTAAALFFQQLISNTALLVVFKQSSVEEKWEVDLMCEGINVANALVKAGHAVYVDQLMGLKGAMPGRSQLQKCMPDRENK